MPGRSDDIRSPGYTGSGAQRVKNDAIDLKATSAIAIRDFVRIPAAAQEQSLRHGTHVTGLLAALIGEIRLSPTLTPASGRQCMRREVKRRTLLAECDVCCW